MPDPITSLQGDMVDAICRRTYGDESGYAEAVLEANPGLAALGAVLPMGTVVVLPEIEDTISETAVVTLWD